MKSLETILILLTVIYLGSAQSLSLRGDSCQCHQRNLDYCSSHLYLLSQPMPMMSANENFDRICVFLNESYQCRQDYLNRCSTPSGIFMIQMMTQKNDAAFKELCAENTKWRPMYVSSHYCLQTHRMATRPCILDYQAALEAAMKNEVTHIPGGCCAYNRLMNCTSTIILENCGEDALAVSKKFADIFASHTAHNLCRSYPFDGVYCVNFLPPVGTLPTGDSFASYNQMFGQNHGLGGNFGSMNIHGHGQSQSQNHGHGHGHGHGQGHAMGFGQGHGMSMSQTMGMANGHRFGLTMPKQT